jgi:hypothetical protein
MAIARHGKHFLHGPEAGKRARTSPCPLEKTLNFNVLPRPQASGICLKFELNADIFNLTRN